MIVLNDYYAHIKLSMNELTKGPEINNVNIYPSKAFTFYRYWMR